MHRKTEAGVEVFLEDSPLSTSEDEDIKIIEISTAINKFRNQEEIKLV
ncbi:MAG: hypothetical protein U5K71_10645 [Gracilimonas sp.]|nr:hypothetical protein [Gracilimonas sp.]